VVRGTSTWGRWWLQTLEVMRDTDRGANLSQAREEEYAVLMAPWTDPSFWFLTALLHGCSGQRLV